jgi:hypothetical protein
MEKSTLSTSSIYLPTYLHIYLPIYLAIYLPTHTHNYICIIYLWVSVEVLHALYIHHHQTPLARIERVRREGLRSAATLLVIHKPRVGIVLHKPGATLVVSVHEPLASHNRLALAVGKLQHKALDDLDVLFNDNKQLSKLEELISY